MVNEWKSEFESLGRLQPEYRKLCLERVKKLIGQIDTCEGEPRHVQLAERHSNICIHIVDAAAEVRVCALIHYCSFPEIHRRMYTHAMTVWKISFDVVPWCFRRRSKPQRLATASGVL